MPTVYGGHLKLDGGPPEVYYTDGSDLSFSEAIAIVRGDEFPIYTGGDYKVPFNQFGWYCVYLPTGQDAVMANFSQIGVAGLVQNDTKIVTRPWNFYWWASKGDHIEDGGNGRADTQKLQSSDDLQVTAVGQPVSAAEENDVVRCGSR